MGHNLKAIMKVMQFAIRRGKTMFNLHSLIRNETISSKLLKYHLDKSHYKQRAEQFDTTSMIPWCSLNNAKKQSWHENRLKKVEPCT